MSNISKFVNVKWFLGKTSHASVSHKTYHDIQVCPSTTLRTSTWE